MQHQLLVAASRTQSAGLGLKGQEFDNLIGSASGLVRNSGHGLSAGCCEAKTVRERAAGLGERNF